MAQKQVAVFDFSADDCAHTAHAVQESMGRDVQVVEYTVMQKFTYDFLDRRKAGRLFDMVFIGVDNMLGVETARNIRELSESCPMFLVSERSDFGLEGFRLHALDYLTKPVSADRVKRAVQRIGTGPDARKGNE